MKKNYSHSYLIIALFLVITVDTMGIGFVWPLFGPLFTGKDTTLFTSAVSMEWRNILYGITIGVANLAAFFSAPILGDLSDYVGRRRVIVFCLLGTALGMGVSVFGVIRNQVPLIIFSRIWLGTVAASQVIAQAAIIDISTANNKSTRLGIISAANNIGFIFGPVVSSVLVDNTLVHWFNITTPFYFAATLAFLGAMFLLQVFKKTPKTSETSALQPIKPHLIKRIFIFTRALSDKYMRAVAITYFCLQIGWALYLQTNFLLLIQRYNYSSSTLGYFLAWLGVTFCFSLLVVVRWLTRLISLNKIIVVTLIMASVCCLVGSFCNTELGVWFNILPMAVAVALGSNALLTTLSNIAKAHEQGWAMGIGGSLAALAWAIIPPITGAILIFGFEVPLFIAGLVFLFGVVLFIKK